MIKTILTVSAAALLCAPAFAADGARNSGGPAALVEMAGVQQDGSPEGFGTTTNTAVGLEAHAFQPIDSGVTYNFMLAGGNLALFRNNATGNPWVEAPINLPSGSLIQSVEFRFCDTSTTKSFQSFLTISNKTGAGSVTQPPLVSSTAAENIGCVNRTFTFGTPVLVNNNDNVYSLEINMGANPGDNTIAVTQARVYYRLQVSPAPATATFTDVPLGHPQLRFVEALVAAGITGGCGAGVYCPDAPLTRGQMAVFLSTALGLHFPN